MEKIYVKKKIVGKEMSEVTLGLALYGIAPIVEPNYSSSVLNAIDIHCTARKGSKKEKVLVAMGFREEEEGK